VSGKPSLLFVTPRYLIPADSGGKIRTSDILRGLKGGVFDVTLASPAPAGAAERDAAQLDGLCDRFAAWPEPERGPWFPVLRLAHLAGPLPVSVATDRSAPGLRRVAEEIAKQPDVVVIDFAHAAVLMPGRPQAATVMFTHNVEAEIFRRHAEQATGLRQWVWRDQARKMERFEREEFARFDKVIAVSERDRAFFAEAYGLADAAAIPTGVDLGYFAAQPPRPAPDPQGGTLVFTGSMDWRANLEGIGYFMEEVWPLIVRQRPQARFVLVGRNPPASLLETVKKKNLNWNVTGFVDDVRPYVRDADVFVMPLRIGGGTRIKAFEAMAMGRPVVSTSLGVEGLPVKDGRHYWRGDDAQAFAAAVNGLLADPPKARELAANARALVEDNFSARRVAAVFESLCVEAMRGRASRQGA
jgi:glycosyltransferase involved in cell wall biosynthesis